MSEVPDQPTQDQPEPNTPQRPKPIKRSFQPLKAMIIVTPYVLLGFVLVTLILALSGPAIGNIFSNIVANI